jgi:hypothetical protein
MNVNICIESMKLTPNDSVLIMMTDNSRFIYDKKMKLWNSIKSSVENLEAELFKDMKQ